MILSSGLAFATLAKSSILEFSLIKISLLAASKSILSSFFVSTPAIFPINLNGLNTMSDSSFLTAPQTSAP